MDLHQNFQNSCLPDFPYVKSYAIVNWLLKVKGAAVAKNKAFIKED